LRDDEKERILLYSEQEQLEEYRKWPVERRLKWLYYANKMRRELPKKTIEIQELFRGGKI